MNGTTIRLLKALFFAHLGVASTAAAQQVVRLPAADAPLSARPQVRYTVGAEEGRDWEVFANVASLAFDAADNLYVFDQGNARVVVFDSAGRYVRTIGKRGGGPGEFTVPTRMTITAGGEVVVADVARQAFSVFGTDGRFRRSVPFARGALLTGPKLAAHPRGGVVSFTVGDPAASGSPDALGVERVLWDRLQGGAPAPLFTARSEVGARQTVYSPTTRFAVLPGGGAAVASTETYAVRVVDANGAAARVLQRPIAPRRVTAADREREMERRKAMSRPGGLTIVGQGAGALPPSMRAQVAAQLQDVEFAAVMPVIQGLETDAAGNLWIQRAGPALDRPGPIDIVTPQGRYVGTLTGVRLPTAFSARGRAAYVERDELDVQRVVVVRLPARWR